MVLFRHKFTHKSVSVSSVALLVPKGNLYYIASVWYGIYLLMNNFHCIPYLSLASVNVRESFAQKVIMSLNMIFHESMNIAMNPLHSFCTVAT